MTLEVIGAGFARTGTLSMQRALNDLGFGPTYHMNDVFENRSHVDKWLKYGETGKANWDTLFGSYRACVDFPASCAWRDLYDKYPEAKIILTVRDPASWWKSVEHAIYPTRTMFPAWFQKLVPFTHRWVDMVDRLVWSGIFEGRFLDQDYATGVFSAHTEAVVAHCDPERLLVFEVSQGWEPLCEFLGVGVPSKPFPHLNDSKSLRRRFTFIRWFTRLMPFLLLFIVAIATYMALN